VKTSNLQHRTSNVQWIIPLLLALITVLVYLPVRQHHFVSYDDPKYVTGNRMVQAGLTWGGAAWAFTTGQTGNWHPLTWLSHMLDVQLFGASPAGPHLVSVLFHTANTVLLFLLLRRLTGALWCSAWVAALFALHPLHVESVAWVAERKDVLSGFFFLLTLLAYARYAQSQLGTLALDARRPARNYVLALFFFALGLMCKPMLVTLPFIMLLLDYWPLQRFNASTLQKAVVEKIPFFLLSAISCVVTFVMQQKDGDVQSLSAFPAGERVGNALVSYARYLGKTFWPADLAVFYPHPGHWPAAQATFAAILIAGLCLAVLWFGRRFPFAVTGWFWFFGMLIPTVGLVQVGNQSMADRYMYLPSIGLFVILAWSAREISLRWRSARGAMAMMGGLAVIACGVVTIGQLQHWQDDESLFRHALTVTRGNFVAHNNLGNDLLRRGQVAEAIVQYQQALAIQPGYELAHCNLGAALLQRGEVDEAIVEFQKALALQADLSAAHEQLGNALIQKGQVDEAVMHYEKALESQPDLTQAHVDLASALLEKGQAREALAHGWAALKMQPDDPAIMSDMAWVLATWPEASVRNGTQAIQLAEQANRLTAGQDAITLRALAAAYAEGGQFAKAVSTARNAVELAASQSNQPLAAALQSEIRLYQTGAPFRETPPPARKS
jgi:tetratricopeptide (TPR) repeat protein